MEGLLPAVEGLWAADAGSAAVADFFVGEKKTSLVRNYINGKFLSLLDMYMQLLTHLWHNLCGSLND